MKFGADTKTIKAPEISERFRSRDVLNVPPSQQEPPAHAVAHRLSEEKHYTPSELASIFHFSPAAIRKLFRNESGVLKLQGEGSAYGKRSYTTFSIPESVAFFAFASVSLSSLSKRNFRDATHGA